MGYLIMLPVHALHAVDSALRKIEQDKAEDQEYGAYINGLPENAQPLSRTEYFRPRREEEARERRHREQLNAMHEISRSVDSLKYRSSW